jgi:hypothetical protein
VNTRKYKYVCDSCGSDKVTCDAPVEWDVGQQDWVICGTPYDDDYCADCEDSCRVEVEYLDETS